MKNLVAFIFVIILCVIIFPNGNIRAQNPDPTEEIHIPFIDRDGDGVNDVLQNGWGRRFVERYKKRQKIWEQLNVEIVNSENP